MLDNFTLYVQTDEEGSEELVDLQDFTQGTAQAELAIGLGQSLCVLCASVTAVQQQFTMYRVAYLRLKSAAQCTGGLLATSLLLVSLQSEAQVLMLDHPANP